MISFLPRNRAQAAIHPARIALAAVLLSSFCVRARAFNMGDYFPLVAGDTWHYTGAGEPGSSIDDNFSWTVLSGKKAVGSGGSVMASQIMTTVDNPGDARENDVDFWFLDTSTGDLFFYGYHNGVADTCIPVQDVVLTDPLRIGGTNLQVGDVVNDTAAATVQTCFGPVSGTLNSAVTYLEIIPSFATPLGTFNNVLHLRLSITGSAPPFVSSFPVRSAEIWLKQGIGMVQQDQKADPNDAQIQAIDSGSVNGSAIIPDGGTPTPTPTGTATPTPTPTGTATPTPTPTASPTATPTPTGTGTPTPTPTPPPCVTFHVLLDGAQAGTNSTGTGEATVTVDTVANTLTYHVTYTGLTGPASAAHIHGFAPRGTATTNILHGFDSAATPIDGVWSYAEGQEAQILAGLTYINIHTAANPSGEIRGQIDNGFPCDMDDFTTGGGTDHGFIGGAIPGFGGSTSVGASGLCMTVPGPGQNDVLFVSPERFIELTANTIYRARVALTTDQTMTDAIPLVFFIYDNFVAGQPANNFGGSSWFLDVDGGAEGIGRPQGRSSFDFFFAPNAIATTQWNGAAFTPAADLLNDIRIQFRLIDANATLLSDNDSGTVCVLNVEITAFPRSSLSPGSTLYNPPISGTTHFAEAINEMGVGGTAVINDVHHEAEYQLTTVGDARKTLGPFDPSQPDLNTQLYPVVWSANTLYRTRISIHSGSAAVVTGGGIAPPDPVDVIFVAMDTTTIELGTQQFTTRGAPGSPMDKAASPTGVSQSYETYLYGQNATTSLTPNANRLRPLGIFFNTTDQAGDGTGADPFVVDELEVDTLAVP